MQAAQGDNEGERPMWAEKGGLDFEGRARWDAWTERKGMKPPRAKMLFVQVPPARRPSCAALPPLAPLVGTGWGVVVHLCDEPCCMLQYKLLGVQGVTLKAPDGHRSW